MPARVINDIRALLPICLGSMVLLFSSMAFETGARLMIAPIVFCMSCAMIGIYGFGLEISYNTQLQLLSQPIRRSRLWIEKLGVQIVALGSIVLVFGMTITGTEIGTSNDDAKNLHLALSGLIPIVALGCGSLLALTLRHAQGAFWVLIFIAAALFWTLEAMWPQSFDTWRPTGEILIFLIVALICLFSGRSRFIHYQDYSLIFGDISLSVGRRYNRSHANQNRSEKSGAIASLFKKELCLQQINLIIIGCALLGGLFIPSNNKWMGPVVMKEFICIIAPMLIGAVAVAEEKRLEICAWQLTLPPPRLIQWIVKVVVCLTLAMASGAALILIPRWLAPGLENQGFIDSIPLSSYAVYAVCGVCLGLLSSSAARSYAQATGILALLLMSFFLLDRLFVSVIIRPIGEIPPENLFRMTGMSLLVIYSLVQGYRNFLSIQSNGKLLTVTVAGLVAIATLTTGSTVFLYNRGWELLIPDKSTEAEIISPADAKAFLSGFDGGFTVDPDGRLWEVERPDKDRLADEMPSLTRIGSDTDWKQAVSGFFGQAALKKDGTLWARARQPRHDKYQKRKLDSNKDFYAFPGELSQITPDHRWLKIDLSRAAFVGLQSDGTLWTWGSNMYGGFGETETSLVWVEPHQVGTDSDWADIVSTEEYDYRFNVALKTDGTTWRWGIWTRDEADDWNDRVNFSTPQIIKELEPYYVVGARFLKFNLATKLKDGRVIVWHGSRFGRSGIPFFNSKPISSKIDLLRSDIDWTNIELSYRDAYALTTDQRIIVETGSPVRNPISKDWSIRLTEHPLHSSRDWAAIKRIHWDTYWGLKTDGSLWFWSNALNNVSSNDSSYLYKGKQVQPSYKQLIPYPFRPQRLGSIAQLLAK